MNDNVNVVNLIGSVMIPLLALIISVSLYRRGISQTVVDFFTQGDSTELKDCRKKLYNVFEKNKKAPSIETLLELDEDGSMAKIISFYDTWATVQKQHLLPLNTFKGITGVTAVKVYLLLRPYIEKRRETITIINDIELNNFDYAKNFEGMVFKIIKKGYVEIKDEFCFIPVSKKNNIFKLKIRGLKNMSKERKKQKKYKLVGQHFYNEATGDKYTRVLKAKDKIEEHYKGVECTDELFHCYKRILVLNFLTDKVFFTMQIGFLSFGLGFLFEKIVEQYDILSKNISSTVQNDPTGAIISFLIFVVSLVIIVLPLLIIMSKNIVKDYKSTQQMFILPYEKKVIEAKLKENPEFKEIIEAMKVDKNIDL